MKKILNLAVAVTLVTAMTWGAGQLKVIRVTTIVEYGKSVDWHHKLDRIASARIGEDDYYDVFMMKPDGTDIRILTHALPGCPQKHNGNPCFHPSGEFIVFTGENERLPDKNRAVRRVAVPGSGLGANLFVIAINTRKVSQLTKYRLTRPIRSLIHPQFSNNGKKLAWSERVRKGDNFGGGWEIRIAQFVSENLPHLIAMSRLRGGVHMSLDRAMESLRSIRLAYCYYPRKAQPVRKICRLSSTEKELLTVLNLEIPEVR